MSFEQLNLFEDEKEDRHITETRLFAVSQVLAVKAEILAESIKQTININNPCFEKLKDSVDEMEVAINKCFNMFKENK